MSNSDKIDQLREEKKDSLLDESATQTTEETVSTPDEIVYVTSEDELSETVNQYPLVFLEFYADWCGPCKMLEPVLEDLAKTTDAAIAKVDVDQNQRLASQYQVRGVPTMVLFENGEAVEQLTGARDQQTLDQLLEQYGA